MLGTQPFMRDDTFLGVCASLGEDFGFNPILLRAALAPLLVSNPLVVGGIYAAAGLLIALLHWMVPNPRTRPHEAARATPMAEADPAATEQMNLWEEQPLQQAA